MASPALFLFLHLIGKVAVAIDCALSLAVVLVAVEAFVPFRLLAGVCVCVCVCVAWLV